MPEPNLEQTACILCYVKLRPRGRDRGPTGSRACAATARTPGPKGYLCQKAAAADWYGDHADRLTTPLRRRPDGSARADHLGHRAHRDRGQLNATRATHGGARSRSMAAAGRAITSAAPTAGSSARRSAPTKLHGALAGEDRRLLGERPALRRPALPHHRGRRARRLLVLFIGSQSLDGARLPDGARHT